MSRVLPAEKGRKPVAGGKGAAAEGGKLQVPPGQTENIRLTVAFAESYALIVSRRPDGRRTQDAADADIGRVSFYRQSGLQYAGIIFLREESQ